MHGHKNIKNNGLCCEANAPTVVRFKHDKSNTQSNCKRSIL